MAGQSLAYAELRTCFVAVGGGGGARSLVPVLAGSPGPTGAEQRAVDAAASFDGSLERQLLEAVRAKRAARAERADGERRRFAAAAAVREQFRLAQEGAAEPAAKPKEERRGASSVRSAFASVLGAAWGKKPAAAVEAPPPAGPREDAGSGGPPPGGPELPEQPENADNPGEKQAVVVPPPPPPRKSKKKKKAAAAAGAAAAGAAAATAAVARDEDDEARKQRQRQAAAAAEEREIFESKYGDGLSSARVRRVRSGSVEELGSSPADNPFVVIPNSPQTGPVAAPVAEHPRAGGGAGVRSPPPGDGHSSPSLVAASGTSSHPHLCFSYLDGDSAASRDADPESSVARSYSAQPSESRSAERSLSGRAYSAARKASGATAAAAKSVSRWWKGGDK